ncbi:MAG: hypothetical protein SWZ49_13025 [Cyanobacteriota bacterium]|nr:hypothetical protein [Cyanobacteriota bacterium]
MNQKIQFSRSQRIALEKALWKIESSNNTNSHLYKTRMKWLLLRAFTIYKRRQNLSTAELSKYQQALQQRLQACLELQPEKNIEIPYYLFSFWNEVFNSANNINKQQTIKTKPASKKNNIKELKRKNINIALSDYRKFCVALIKRSFDITNQSSTIIQLKKTLGCISLIPIKIGNEHIKVKGVCIHYHDLYHFEVAQLERIRMGKHMVSGVHGLKVSLFHNSLKPEEYDGFLDEARIAIHEGLTRPTAFSIIKALCWMTLLALQGINSFAVVIRHIKSMKNKQKEFCSSLGLASIRCPA